MTRSPLSLIVPALLTTVLVYAFTISPVAAQANGPDIQKNGGEDTAGRHQIMQPNMEKQELGTGAKSRNPDLLNPDLPDPNQSKRGLLYSPGEILSGR